MACDIVVFGQVGLHDYVDASGNASALAVGGEIEIGTWLDRWHARAGVLAGDNWQLLDPASLDPASFLTGQAIVTYYHALDNERLAGVEPLARISYGDPDTGSGDNRGILLTPGLPCTSWARTGWEPTSTSIRPRSATPSSPLKVQSTLFF